MDATTKTYIEALSTAKKAMVDQLCQLSQVNSGTENLEGLAEVRQLLIAAFEPFSDEIQRYSPQPIQTINMKGDSVIQMTGDILFIRKRPELKRRILLCGHMDTVYSAEHAFQKLTYLNDNQLNGPGVTDMKGGLVVLCHALSTFEKLSIAPQLGWDVIINADEEIGSLGSSFLFKDLAQNYQAALVYEPTLSPEGTLAKNRSGSGKFTLIATGKASHVGRAFYEGHNAICYLAEVITAIHALNSPQRNFTVNVGKIAGGEALNIVPDKAVAKLDIRAGNLDAQVWITEKLTELVNSFNRAGYSLTLQGQFNRPVKQVSQSTQKLFLRIQQLGNSLGIPINWKDSGGCCDGNNLASYDLPVIDTLGVRGGNIHSAEEFIFLDSLVERAQLNTLIFSDLAYGGLEDLKL